MNPYDFGEQSIPCSIPKKNNIIYDKDRDVIISQPTDIKIIYPVYQNESFIATPYDPIVGSFGLDSSICIIMRDPYTNKTMIANTDKSNILSQFFNEFQTSYKVHVYMMGGNIMSFELCDYLITSISNRYTIKFVHLIDKNNNSIGINSITGELYVNPEIKYFQDFP